MAGGRANPPTSALRGDSRQDSLYHGNFLNRDDHTRLNVTTR
jgi:hypothetical protein